MPLAPHQLPWTGTGLIRVDADGYVKIFDPSTGKAAATFDSTSGIITGPVTLGSGDNLDVVAVTTVGQQVDIRIGTQAAPDGTTSPALKVSRTISNVPAGVQGDGSEQLPAISGIAQSDAANQVQSIGVYGAAKNKGNSHGATDNPDACGGYFLGRILDANAVGGGLGVCAIGRVDVATARSVNAAQMFVYNNSGGNDSVNPLGQSYATGISFYSFGTNLGGACMEIVGTFVNTGSQFDVGLHFSGQNGQQRVDANCGTTNASNVVTDAACVAADFNKTVTGTGIPANTVVTAVTPGVSFTISKNATATNNPVALTLALQGGVYTAGIYDDSDSQYGIYMTANANHQKGAIVLAQDAGSVLIGEVAPLFASSKLEVVAPTGGAAPLAVFSSNGAAEALTVVLRNGSGSASWFVSAGAGNQLTGTVAGDTGVKVATAAKFWHVGGSISTIKVGQDNSLGFFNVASVAQQNTTGNVHTVAAGATTSVFTNTTFDGSTGATAYTVGDLVKALKAYGLLAA